MSTSHYFKIMSPNQKGLNLFRGLIFALVATPFLIDKNSAFYITQPFSSIKLVFLHCQQTSEYKKKILLEVLLETLASSVTVYSQWECLPHWVTNHQKNNLTLTEQLVIGVSNHCRKQRLATNDWWENMTGPSMRCPKHGFATEPWLEYNYCSL